MTKKCNLPGKCHPVQFGQFAFQFRIILLAEQASNDRHQPEPPIRWSNVINRVVHITRRAIEDAQLISYSASTASPAIAAVDVDRGHNGCRLNDCIFTDWKPVKGIKCRGPITRTGPEKVPYVLFGCMQIVAYYVTVWKERGSNREVISD